MRFVNFSYAIENVETSFYRWMIGQIGTKEDYANAKKNGKFRLFEDYLDYKVYMSVAEDTHPSLKKLWKVGHTVDYSEGTVDDPIPVRYRPIRRFKAHVVDVFMANYEFHMWLIELCRSDEASVELITNKRKKLTVPTLKSPYDRIKVQEWIDSMCRSVFDDDFPSEFVRDECDLTEEVVNDVEHLFKNKIVYKGRTGGVEEEDWDDHTISQMYIYAIAFFRKFPKLMAMNKDLKHIVPQMLAETHGTVVSVMRQRQILWYVPYDLATRHPCKLEYAHFTLPPRELAMVIGHIPFVLSIEKNERTGKNFYYLLKMDYHNLSLRDQIYNPDFINTGCLCQSPVRRDELK